MKRPLDEIEAFRAQELLLARATEGLTDAEAAELAALGADDDVSFDLAAAAIDVATVSIEAMPADVADKILIAAGVSPSVAAVPTTLAGVVPPRPARSFTPEQTPAPIERPADTGGAAIVPIRRSRTPMIVALASLAAGVAIAVGAFVWASRKPPEIVYRTPELPTPDDARRALLASATDVATLAWTTTPDPAAAGASGDVVWSASRQEGYMRFRGLAANDPTKTQYQLWIFDKHRDDKYPVDGGVFDVGPDGEVVVKIAPKLHVDEPVLFAVTVEAPGGVVVSGRERIVVTAAVPGAG